MSNLGIFVQIIQATLPCSQS